MNGISFWLGFAVLVALTAAGLRYYLPLARAVLVQGRGLVGVEWVGRIDAVLALALAAWFLLLGRQALLAGGEAKLDFQDVVTGAFLYAGIVLFLLGVWFYRNLAPARIFGFGPTGFGRALGPALLGLAAAYPLLMLVQAMVYGGAHGSTGPQEVVEFLRHADSPRDRIAVMIMAVVVAPVAEEIIFRGFLYPVAKKYLGVVAAVAGTSLLFAVLHGHLPSVPALCTLAVCLALCYERSGTLLVPMIMHAVFNAVSVAAIIYFT